MHTTIFFIYCENSFLFPLLYAFANKGKNGENTTLANNCTITVGDATVE